MASKELSLQALLAPGWRFGLVVGLWWLLRAAGLYAMRAFSDVPLDAFALANGLLFDAMMIWGLFLRARAHRLLSSGPRSTLTTSLRLILAVEVPLLALVMTALRGIDVIACYFALSHATEDVWHHVSPGSLGYWEDPRVLGSAAALLLISGGLVALARADAKPALKVLDGRPATALQATWRVLAAVIVAWAPPLLAPVVQEQHPHHWAIVPEVNGAYTLARHLTADEVAEAEDVQLPQVPAATVTAWRNAGLIAPGQDPNGQWPMLRSGLGRLDTLPAAATPTKTGAVVGLASAAQGRGRPPNVLIVLVESLNSGFTGLDARSKHPQLMPRLQRWAARMTLVRGFHNVASPTANGLVASLCAALPASAVSEIQVGGSVDQGAAYRCIADVLQEHGYRSHFARGASKVYMACEASLRSHGFDEVHGREDLRHLYPAAPTNSWGYYDQTLVDFLLKELQRLAAKPQPWLYATLTVNSHLPGFPEPTCNPPPAIAANSILAGYWCTDAALDRLLSGMEALGLLDNTLIAITGDHAQLPTRKVQALIDQPQLFGAFAPMPLLLHDPLHRLPKTLDVLSSQVDLVPTLLHLLGLDDATLRHSFMGYSIFGQRRDHPFLVGRTGKRSAYVQGPSARSTHPMGTLPAMCERRTPILPGSTAPLDACQLRDYYRWLDAVWAGRRMFPADEYRGGIGADAELLRLKWLRYDRKEERQRRKKGVQERRVQ